MKPVFAFICDYAEIHNKINALGIGFDTITAKKVPYTHPLFFLVIQLRATVVEVGEWPFRVDLIDYSGQSIIPPLESKITVARPQDGSERTLRVAMRLNNVRFPRYDTYSIRVGVGPNEVADIPLRVVPFPPTPEGTG
jgi:hypothetical protein